MVVFAYTVYFKKNQAMKDNCVGWEDGLKGSKLRNTPESKCKIHPPKTCYYQIFDGLFDVSRMIGDTCENNGSNQSKILRNIFQIRNRR
jgi:hypothetical protein